MAQQWVACCWAVAGAWSHGGKRVNVLSYLHMVLVLALRLLGVGTLRLIKSAASWQCAVIILLLKAVVATTDPSVQFQLCLSFSMLNVPVFGMLR